MANSFMGNGTVIMKNMPTVSAYATAVGKKEGDGPLADHFDYISDDVSMGEQSWEKAESMLQKNAFRIALQKGSLSETDIDFMFAGDLLNQCTSSSYAMRDFTVPYIGIYGACSNMAESLALASLFIDAGYGNNVMAMTSSHFCSAERQYRMPLNYGGQRTTTAQWTATAAGCAIVSARKNPPYIKSVTIGKINDMGIKDANNMGAAMSGAAYETITTHFKNTNTNLKAYDMILTGDLGKVGSDLLFDLFSKDKINISGKHKDCGLMLYDLEKQDTHCGGSGCGCSASVLCGYILDEIAEGRLKNVLFVATGALLSPTLIQQGESIPSVAHAVHLAAQ